MNVPKHTVTWFEIPVSDLERASKFYSAVFEETLKAEESQGGMKMAVFPSKGEPGDYVVHGALVQADGYEPGNSGALVYFNGGQDLSGALGRVVEAGGKVLLDKMSIGDHGFIAWFQDSEGNRVALHSPS